MKKEYNGEQVAAIAKAVKRKERFVYKFLKDNKITLEQLSKNDELIQKVSLDPKGEFKLKNKDFC